MGDGEEVEEAVQEVVLDDKKPEQSTRLSTKQENTISCSLKKEKHCFMCDFTKIPGIDPEVITHKLNFDHKFKLVKQRSRKLLLKKSINK